MSEAADLFANSNTKLDVTCTGLRFSPTKEEGKIDEIKGEFGSSMDIIEEISKLSWQVDGFIDKILQLFQSTKSQMATMMTSFTHIMELSKGLPPNF